MASVEVGRQPEASAANELSVEGARSWSSWSLWRPITPRSSMRATSEVSKPPSSFLCNATQWSATIVWPGQ